MKWLCGDPVLPQIFSHAQLPSVHLEDPVKELLYMWGWGKLFLLGFSLGGVNPPTQGQA